MEIQKIGDKGVCYQKDTYKRIKAFLSRFNLDAICIASPQAHHI